MTHENIEYYHVHFYGGRVVLNEIGGFMDRLRSVFLNANALAWLLFVCIVNMVATGMAFATEGVGDVISVKPGAYVLRGGERLPLALQSRVYQQDILVTDERGKLQIILDDDTTLSLASSTRIDLQTVVPEGKPEFKAHVSSGLARFITGKIVDKNPNGFKVSTPEGTVGIRGTMFAVRTGSGETTLFVFNASRNVVLNDISVPPGEMLTVGPRILAPTPIPMTTQQMDEVDRQTASGVGANGVEVASPNEKTTNDRSLAFADTNTAPVSSLAEMRVNDMTTLDLPTTKLLVPYYTASVFGTTAGSSNFAFMANVTTGKIYDGFLTFNSASGYYENGTGSMNANSFHVGNFSVSTFDMSSSTPSEAAATSINGTYSITGNTLTIDSGGTVDIYFGGGANAAEAITGGSGTIKLDGSGPAPY